jgi:hypothetical protein
VSERRGVRVDVLVAALLMLAAGLIGTVYVERFVANGGKQAFYQSYFEPAVNWTCGHGFVRSVGAVPEPVRAFLATERDSLSCAEVTPAATTREGLYQRAWLYLMLTVGTVWRVAGMSWSGLAPLFGVLFALTIGLSYGLIRHVAGRWISAGVTALFALSALHLANLPHLRDYAKAPFVLALVLLLVRLVVRPTTTPHVLAIAAAYGAVLGVGYGFRSDLLANVPPYVVALGFLPVAWNSHLALRASALAVTAAVFFIVAAPVNQQVATTGSCLGHVTLLGFSSPFTDALRVEPASYDLAIVFNDEVLDSAVTGYANRLQPGTGDLEYCAPEYDRVTAAYLTNIARVFPGDLVTRAYAATRRVLNAPFQSGVLLRLDGIGVGLALAGLLVVAVFNLRLAVFALLMLLYFGGYPAAQFAPRHYFHLEFVGWLLIALLAQQTLTHVRMRRWPSFAPGDLSGAAAFAVIAFVIVAAPLWIARIYQHRAVSDMLAASLVAAAAGTSVPSADTVDGWVAEFSSMDQQGRLLAVEVEAAANCTTTPRLTVTHRTALSRVDWSRQLDVSGVATTALIPLDTSAVAVRLDALSCARVRRATTIDPAALPSPLLLYAAAPQNWQQGGMRLHQTLQ